MDHIVERICWLECQTDRNLIDRFRLDGSLLELIVGFNGPAAAEIAHSVVNILKASINATNIAITIPVMEETIRVIRKDFPDA